MALADRLRRSGVVRMFGTGVIVQALLSGASFAVGLILIRRTSNLDYSYYVLATNTLLLLSTIQGAFLNGYTVIGLNQRDEPDRQLLIGSLVRLWTRSVPWLCALAILGTAALWSVHVLTTDYALLIAVSAVAALTYLHRDFFRMTLFAYRQPFPVLHGDLVYVVLLIASAYVATLTSLPAQIAVVGMALAALAGGMVQRRSVHRHESWRIDPSHRILRGVVAYGGWGVVGASIHWLLIQGYGYLTAAVLSVGDVAPIAATRLCLVPIFVVSSGASMFLFPITSRWVEQAGAAVAARKLAVLVAALVLGASCYVIVMWLARDWIFSDVLKKHFAHRDALLLLWSAVFLITLCRDQLATLPAATARFRDLSLFTAAGALVWLVASYGGMLRWGTPGAVAGILAGEAINLIGIIWLILRDVRRPRPALEPG